MATVARNISQLLTRKNLFKNFMPCKKWSSSVSGLDLGFKNDVAVITMSNKDNRLNATFLKEFNVLLDTVEENESCKGLITTGAGKFYSNGIDLEWCNSLTEAEEVVNFLHNLNAFLLRIVMFPIPTLAMINGHAFAGGAMLASAHDLRVMNTDKGWLCLNEVFLKIRFSEVMLSYLKLKFGGGKNLADAIILGRRYTAAEALSNSLIHAASPGASQEEESMQLLKSYLGKEGIPRGGVTMMKKHIYDSVQQAYQAEAADNYETFASQFLNKTQRSSRK